MTNGYQNEIDFINYLNNKKFEELNIMMQDVIKSIYPNIKSKDIIKASKYGRYAKTDIVITVRNKKRGISLKCGYKNSIHVEPITKFKKFLVSNNVDERTIDMFLRYLYSDGTNNNTGKIRITNAEYIDEHKSDIKILNETFANLKPKIIKRFLIETDIKYNVKVDMFIHGKLNDFIWATAEEVKEFLEKEEIISTIVHSGKIYIQNWDKNIKRNEKYEFCREYIQAKWFSMYDDMIAIIATRENY